MPLSPSAGRALHCRGLRGVLSGLKRRLSVRVAFKPYLVPAPAGLPCAAGRRRSPSGCRRCPAPAAGHHHADGLRPTAAATARNGAGRPRDWLSAAYVVRCARTATPAGLPHGLLKGGAADRSSGKSNPCVGLAGTAAIGLRLAARWVLRRGAQAGWPSRAGGKCFARQTTSPPGPCAVAARRGPGRW